MKLVGSGVQKIEALGSDKASKAIRSLYNSETQLGYYVRDFWETQQHTSTHARTLMHTHTHAHVCTHAHTHTMHAYSHTHTHACMHAHSHTHTHIHIHTHTLLTLEREIMTDYDSTKYQFGELTNIHGGY